MNDLVCFNKNDELKGVVKQSKSRFKIRRKKELFQHLFSFKQWVWRSFKSRIQFKIQNEFLKFDLWIEWSN